MRNAIRPRARAMPRGFTLIELLTVMGIILFLVAFIVGIFIRYGEQAKVKATQKLLERIGIALARYKADFRELPPDTGYGMPPLTPFPPESKILAGKVVYDSAALWRYLGQEVVKKRLDPSGAVSIVGVYGPYIKFSDGELAPNDGTGKAIGYDDPSYPGKSYYVVDAWHQPVGYVGDPRRVVHNRGDFDLFSAGPDRKTAINDGIDNDSTATPNLPESNQGYDGAAKDDALEMGEAALNGSLTGAKKKKEVGEVLDDINNWDPQM